MLFGYSYLSVFIGGEAKIISCITSTAPFESAATRLVNFIYRTQLLIRQDNNWQGYILTGAGAE